MNILLTGSTGFVGLHLKKFLQLEGHFVDCFNRNDSFDDHSYKYDAIINCAAELTDESKMFESNLILVHKLLEFARINNIKKFIQIGSSSEYGVINFPRKEDSLCIPSNIYEATKLAATNLCIGYAHRYDMDICVARPFSLFGPYDKYRKLIPSLYRAYIENKTIDLYPGSHDWIYIDDFISGLNILLNSARYLTKGDIINFGTSVSSANDMVVKALESALGGSLSVNYKIGRYHNHDVDNWVANISKAIIKYNWNPKYNLESGMKALVMTEWFREDKG